MLEFKIQFTELFTTPVWQTQIAGIDNNQIKDTIHISGSETYVSGSLMGTTTSTPQNETKHFHNRSFVGAVVSS